MPPIITAAQLAERLHVAPSTVLAWHRRGLIPALRASRRPVLFDLDEVERVLTQRAAEERKGRGRTPAPASARGHC